jgi:hypothetical protein
MNDSQNDSHSNYESTQKLSQQQKSCQADALKHTKAINQKQAF